MQQAIAGKLVGAQQQVGAKILGITHHERRFVCGAEQMRL